MRVLLNSWKIAHYRRCQPPMSRTGIPNRWLPHVTSTNLQKICQHYQIWAFPLAVQLGNPSIQFRKHKYSALPLLLTRFWKFSKANVKFPYLDTHNFILTKFWEKFVYKFVYNTIFVYFIYTKCFVIFSSHFISDIAGPSSKRNGESRESKFTVTKNLNDEDPDDSELSAEAKALVLKREKEKERLRKLGKMIPVSTSVESVPAMETYSRTTPFRLIHKDSEYSLYTVKSSSDDLPRRSAMSSNARSSAATSA